MAWSNYRYLAVVFLCALAALFAVYKRREALTSSSKNRTKDELIFLGIISVIGLVAIYWRLYTQELGFCFGPGDTGTDTIEQYVPFYTNLIENIKDGSFDIWSFEYGLGVNLPSYQTWLYDPFNLILIPLGLLLGTDHLSLALVLTQSARILLSAYLFDHLLTRFCEMSLARIVASVLYAFSSYLLLLGQNFFLGSMLPMLTLVVLCYELYLERQSVPRFIATTLSIAVILLWSAYISFMVLLFAATYLLLRIFAKLRGQSPKAYILVILKMCVPVVCGLLLSCVLFVPYAHFLLQETSRTSSSTSTGNKIATSLSFVNIDWIPAILSRLFGGSLLNNGSNTMAGIVSDMGDVSYVGSFPYEFIQLGFSCGILVLLSQFYHWVIKECDKRSRVLIGISTALVIFFCVNRFLPTLFTAMVRFSYRSSGVLGIPICIAIALALEKRVLTGRVAIVPAVVAAFISAAVLGWSMFNAESGKLPSAVFELLLVIAFACLLAAWKKPMLNGALSVVFLGAIVASTFFDGFYCTNNRNLLPIVSYPHSSESPADEPTESALAYVASLDDDMYRLDKTYCDHYLASDSWIEHYQGASAYNSTLDADLLTFYDQLWPEAECAWAYYTQMYNNDPEPDVAVLQLLGIRYIFSYSDHPLTYDWAEKVTQINGSLDVYRVKGSDGFMSVRGNAVGESEANALSSASERCALLADSAIVPDEVANAVKDLSCSSASVSMTKVSEHELTGEVTCDGNAVACIPVPHTGTWDVYVDGEDVETFVADYGFVGFTMPEGTHDVRAVYSIEGMGLGGKITLVGVVFTAVCCVFVARADRKRNDMCLIESEVC